MMASAPCGPTMDLLIETPPNLAQSLVGTLNDNGTPPTVSACLPMDAGSTGPTPGGPGEGETTGGGGPSAAGDSTAAASDAAGVEGSLFVLNQMPRPTVKARAVRTNTTDERPDRLDDPTLSLGSGGGS